MRDQVLEDLFKEVPEIFAKFSTTALEYISKNVNHEAAIAHTYCPAWNFQLEADIAFMHDPLCFCRECKVETQHCPATTFNLNILEFHSFARPGEMIRGKERVARLMKSCFKPMSLMMIRTLLEKQHEKFLEKTKEVRNRCAGITCDRFLFFGPSSHIGGEEQQRPPMTLNQEARRNWGVSHDQHADLDKYVVDAIWWLDSDKPVYKQNALNCVPNRVAYSAVLHR